MNFIRTLIIVWTKKGMLRLYDETTRLHPVCMSPFSKITLLSVSHG